MPSTTSRSRDPLPSSSLPLKTPDLSQKLPRLTPRRKLPQPQRPSSPPPETPLLEAPPPFADLTFARPTRRILSKGDHDIFLSSQTHTLITSFVFTLADSVAGTPISSVSHTPSARHATITSLLAILDTADQILKDNPPDHTTGSRFGSPAFRAFHASFAKLLPSLHARHFPGLPSAAQDELSTYLAASLGSPDRVDYGSGHELHFLIYLLCLHQLSLLPQSTFPAVALVVLPRYLRLMRAAQETYYLEPAGSHGVWGLDDYHFAPFLIGAAQLTRNEAHPFITPLSIHSASTIEAYADEYLYLDMVRYVNSTKTVKGLRWHSPMLDDISGVKGGWTKVYSGMRKMFEGEVVGKLVVMQHFLFGGIVPAADGMTDPEEAESREEGDAGVHDGHAHEGQSWSDCCGIKVPSSVGAIQEMRKRGGGQELRRLPFD